MRQRALRNALLPICMIASLTVVASHAGVLRDDAATTPQGRAAEPAATSSALSLQSAADDNVEDFLAQRYTAFENASRRSGDLRRRILFSLKVIDDEQRLRVEEIIALADLIEAARGSTDPIVLQLLLDRCRDKIKHSRCDAVDLAQRWVVADAQNQLAWIELATVLEQAGDLRGSEEAWSRAGRASTFRDHYFPVVRIILHALPADPDPRVHFADLITAIGIGAAVRTDWPVDTSKGCKSEARRPVCAWIADTVFRDGDSFMALLIAQDITRRTAQSEALAAARKQTVQALLWASLLQSEAIDPDTIDFTDRAKLSAAIRVLEQLIERGAVAAHRDALREMHLSDAEASERYHAWLVAHSSKAQENPRP